ncbi:MAG: hypothetical protein KGZ83_17535 [Sulfuricella sp.]|nr:hypothetical protein [Sulfuricella sp.]
MRKKLKATNWAVFIAALCIAAPAHAQNPPPTPEPRELIYCADQMTHEERETYRAKMSAARTAEEKNMLREAHRQTMQERARQSGNSESCEPQRLRQREGWKR